MGERFLYLTTEVIFSPEWLIWGGGLFPLMDAYFRSASNQVMFHLLIYSGGDSKESSNNDVVLELLIDLLIFSDLIL